VDDRVQAGERVIERVGVADVALDELGVHAREVRLVAAGQVVENADSVAARHQSPHQRRAHEPGAAGDQDPLRTTHKTGSLVRFRRSFHLLNHTGNTRPTKVFSHRQSQRGNGLCLVQ